MTNTPTIRPRLRRSISIPTINKSRISTASDEGNEQSTLSKNVVYHGSFTILPSSSTFYERLVEYRSHEFKSERRVLKELCFVCKGSIRPFFNEGVKCQGRIVIAFFHTKNFIYTVFKHVDYIFIEIVANELVFHVFHGLNLQKL